MSRMRRLGGRNIGNEYFAADPVLEFSDLDVWIKTKPKEGIGLEGTGKLSISLKELAKPFKLGGTLAHPARKPRAPTP